MQHKQHTTHLPVVPEAWLMVLITGLPQLSETVYTPSLPDIARALMVSESMAEYTLTIYLFSFALGILFWGKLSDTVGRKPCVLAGISVFILGCLGCFFSTNITMLMMSRFVQAFGGSIGSVLGQAMVRDSFHGPALGRMYAVFGSSLAVFPAIGPVVGGWIAQQYGWYMIFIFLMIVASILSMIIWWRLPETHHPSARQPNSMIFVARTMLNDHKVIGLCFLVGAANGINFSFFAEGSFYLIEQLGLSPSQYGLCFIAIASSTMLGGMLSKSLQQHHLPKTVLGYGLSVICAATTIFSAFILFGVHTMISGNAMIALTVLLQMCTAFGIVINNGNALAMALVDYKWCTGTASSLFGFSYYILTSILTLGMGYLHNGTLYPMPLYFCAIAWSMFMFKKLLIR
ncbi:multidrug effflux MFS transporter [Candidatus Babeliales bacterium]|nr:multidrug effflux MFS transporter [Candidatus Babeliales bacterium]